MVPNDDEDAADPGVEFTEEEATEDDDDVYAPADDLHRVSAKFTVEFLERLIPALETRDIPYLLQSGTAFGLSVPRKIAPTRWNAVLYVPASYMEAALSLIAELSAPPKFSECPYCKNPVRDETHVIVCERCHTPHHLECWHEKDGCSVFGCSAEMGRIE